MEILSRKGAKVGRRKQEIARRRQEELKRRNQRELESRRAGPKMSRRLIERLEFAYGLIRDGNYMDAEELLKDLDRRSTDDPEVVEALVSLYQETGDHNQCCQAAERWMHLRPRNPEARLIYAQESMLCGRAAIAQLNYQHFIEWWPEHPHVSKAKYALEILVPETDRRFKSSGFPLECGLEWAALHEESLSLLHNGKFSECAQKCRELLAKAPTFVSARNNLAVSYFQSGRPDDAIAVVEDTRRLVPDNRFAEATLAKLYFLMGRVSEAQRLADQIVANPPTQQDSLVAALETLAFLGRDQEIVRVANSVADSAILDDDCRAMRLRRF